MITSLKRAGILIACLSAAISVIVITSNVLAIEANKRYYVVNSVYEEVWRVDARGADSIITRVSQVADTTVFPDTIAATSAIACTVDLKGLALPTFVVEAYYKTRGESDVHDTALAITVRPFDGTRLASWHSQILEDELQIVADSTASPYAGWWGGAQEIRRSALPMDKIIIKLENLEYVAVDSPRVIVGSRRVDNN